MKRPRRLGRYQILANRQRFCLLVAGVPANRASAGGGRMTSEDILAPNTEADQLRQQLLQAQRLSSVGALASSVAHEFNNILTTIINYAKLALRPEADQTGRLQALEKILKGSQRAALISNC